MRLEVFGSGLITTNLHRPQLIPLPFCTGISLDSSKNIRNSMIAERSIRSRFVERTKEMWTPRLRWLEEQSRHR